MKEFLLIVIAVIAWRGIVRLVRAGVDWRGVIVGAVVSSAVLWLVTG